MAGSVRSVESREARSGLSVGRNSKVHKKRGDSVQEVPFLNGSGWGNNGSVGHREIGDYVKTVPPALPKRS
jgi:hypothetical protein